MKTNRKESEVDGYYCPEIKCRWKSYNCYKLLLWAWMMNEVTVVFSPTEISHNGFYVHVGLQAAAVILVGMPLAYSEICLGQYTNCNLFTVWEFFPLFHNVGYASYYLICIKSMYLLVLTSWYLIYTFYAAMNTPPWLNCNEFNDEKCMVKRVNVSTFQHCLESQLLFEDDCGMKTASNCFFEREIGFNCTMKNPNCFRPWKTIVALIIICLSVYVLSIKQKIIQVVVKFLVIYTCVVILLLFGVALSTSGTWYGKKKQVNWANYAFDNCFDTIARGFLTVGTGSGVLSYLSCDVPFRSPATMTTISTCLCSLFVSFILSLIAFSGIKTMSYYHGEEENVIEVGSSLYFPAFASMSEIMIYFDQLPVWGFVWFSVGLLSLYCNFWMLFLLLKETLLESCFSARKYAKTSSFILIVVIGFCTLPILCSDIAGILTDATEMMQTFNSLLLSVSLYWIYGVHNHKVDIIFMIGIKSNYFWKLTWLLNPIMLSLILYRSWRVFQIHDIHDSYYIKSLSITIDMLVSYILLSIYAGILLVGITFQVIKFCLAHKISQIISPSKNWGPNDSILSRSRSMFLPEIMTREFLYRQVRIRGYQKTQKVKNKLTLEREVSDTFGDETTWSALTSN